ncbi:neutral sphingomyelinase [Acrasis kona]|uniref:sphingomyelin phosphodiesterase n=1 Tax=Acrasis kona TaxID=1008807 RepID=A0AAW2ZFQ0_9EUKA
MPVDSVLVRRIVKFWNKITRKPGAEYLMDENAISATGKEQVNVPKAIRVLSYNVFMRPFVKTNKSDYKDARLSVFIREQLDNFDIIALQEMFSLGSNRMKTLKKQSALKGFPFNVTLSGSWSSLKPIDSGLIIMSRYPILERDAIVFKKGRDIDGWANKGALSALIQIPTSADGSTPDLKFIVVTTHLQAEYDVKNPIYLELQVAQLKELRTFLDFKHKQHPNVPIILCGDFNINARADPAVDSIHPSSSYSQMVDLINISNNPNQPHWKELISEKLGYHPQTFGVAKLDENTQEWKPYDTVLTHSVCYIDRSRLDYMFYLPTTQLAQGRRHSDASSTSSERIETDALVLDTTPTYGPNMMLTVAEAKVQPFFVKGHAFTQLSDHFGISTTFSITNGNPHVDLIEEQPVTRGPVFVSNEPSLRLDSRTPITPVGNNSLINMDFKQE